MVLAGAAVCVAGATWAANPIFVLNSLDATISVIDSGTWQETKRIPTGKEPHHLYLTPDEKSLIPKPARCSALCAARWILINCVFRQT